MPKIVDIPEEDLIRFIQEGVTQKEIARKYNCSEPTVRSRIRELMAQEGLWTKYREFQHIHLTKLQYKILSNITEDDIAEASLTEKVNAFRVLKDKELVSTGKPTEIKGLLGYLIEAEKKEQEIKEKLVKEEESDCVDADFSEIESGAPANTGGQNLTKSGLDDSDWLPNL